MTADTDLRALSIRQPWTDLLLAGIKRVENRTWSTAWRGQTALHAGKQRDPRGRKLVDAQCSGCCSLRTRWETGYSSLR